MPVPMPEMDPWVRIAIHALENLYDCIVDGNDPDSIEEQLYPEMLEDLSYVAGLSGFPYSYEKVRAVLPELFFSRFGRPPIFLYAVPGCGLYLAEGEEELIKHRSDQGYGHTDPQRVDTKSAFTYVYMWPGQRHKHIALYTRIQKQKALWGTTWSGAEKIASFGCIRRQYGSERKGN